MKIINLFFTIFQVAAVVVYILFYNVQYFWSLYGTVELVVNTLFK